MRDVVLVFFAVVGALFFGAVGAAQGKNLFDVVFFFLIAGTFGAGLTLGITSALYPEDTPTDEEALFHWE